MFRGSAKAKIDAKGRFKLPTDFRRQLEKDYGSMDVFVTSVGGDCALLYPLRVWEELEEKLSTLPSTDPKLIRFQRRVAYFGQQGVLDAQGRLVLQSRLREKADLVGEVVVFGQREYFEIWNHELFEKHLEEQPFDEEDFGDLSAKGI